MKTVIAALVILSGAGAALACASVGYVNSLATGIPCSGLGVVMADDSVEVLSPGYTRADLAADIATIRALDAIIADLGKGRPKDCMNGCFGDR